MQTMLENDLPPPDFPAAAEDGPSGSAFSFADGEEPAPAEAVDTDPYAREGFNRILARAASSNDLLGQWDSVTEEKNEIISVSDSPEAKTDSNERRLHMVMERIRFFENKLSVMQTHTDAAPSHLDLIIQFP